MDTSKVLPKGRLLNGTYTIEKVLGAGGFGITYLARRMTGNITQWLAVKEFFISSICSRSGDDVWVSNVNQEQYDIGKGAFISQAKRIYLNGIHYPNIVGVNEVFEQNNTAYYVMELVRGCTLSEYVSERGGLDLDAAMGLFVPVMQAVHLLHSMRILHLDLKPENVIIGRDNITDRLRPVLIDFDLSKHYGLDGEVTSAIQFISCSEGYAPREQYELMGISRFIPQADVYALGATLLFMLTGQTPVISSAFDREEIKRMLSPDTPKHLVEAIYKAMAPDVADRTPSVAEMAHDMGIDTIDWPVADVTAGGASSGKIGGDVKIFPWRKTAILACVCALAFGVAYWMQSGPSGLKPRVVAVGSQKIRLMPVVCGTDTFYMADKEVTQALWNEVMGPDTHKFLYDRPDLPAMSMTPDDCERLIEALNKETGMEFRLPTSDEWMFAYRGGPEGSGHRYSGSDDPSDVCWLKENRANPQKIGRKKPNALGLYDMLGNVSELTKDKPSGISILRRGGSDIYHVCGLDWTSEPDSVQPRLPYSKVRHDAKARLGVGLRLVCDYPIK